MTPRGGYRAMLGYVPRGSGFPPQVPECACGYAPATVAGFYKHLNKWGPREPGKHRRAE